MVRLLSPCKDHNSYFQAALHVTRHSTLYNCFDLEGIVLGLGIAQRIRENREMESVTTNVEDGVNTKHEGETMTYSNLRCFLDTVTPIVQTYTDAQVPYLPLQNNNGETIVDGVKYFYLADVWNKFYEWSACGVGTSVRLPAGEMIVQYFVPYLSAIQLYTNKSNAPASQSLGWCSNNNTVQAGTSFGVRNNHIMIDSNTYITGYERPTSICKGELFFKYFELDSPYERMPFVDKVYELCCRVPKLQTLRSIDLSPSSWMSVFWYPSSHVPARSNKDLSTRFLTYHRLSTPKEYVAPNTGHASNYVALAPFGLATHKMDKELWASPNSNDQEHVASLIDAAKSWIQMHDIQHHDFNFFSHCNST